MTPLERFEALAHRFLGVDLQSRRVTCGGGGPGCFWPARWRARLVTSKNEHSDYRLTAYGETADAAMVELQQMVEAVERSHLATVRLDG